MPHQFDAQSVGGLAAGLKEICLSLSGCADFRPSLDGRATLLDLGRGEWLECILDGRCVYPFIGDLERSRNFPRFTKFIESMMPDPATIGELLPAVLSRLEHLIRLMPPDVPGPFSDFRLALKSFIRQHHIPPSPSKRLADIAHLYTCKPRWRESSFEYEQISGRLGVPGTVVKHRDVMAQRDISAGTGDHAGHRIGIRFGAPGDARNMALQNANMNTRAPRALHETFRGSGGSYLDLEDRWESLLLSGVGVISTVRDRYKPGEDRPHSRFVSWTTVDLRGARQEEHLDFLNTGSPQQRAAAEHH